MEKKRFATSLRSTGLCMKPVNLKEIILIVYALWLILKQKTCQKQELAHNQKDIKS